MMQARTLHCLTNVFLLQNIMSSNWQSMRLKYPIPKIGAGWRVEVRTMDVSH